MTRLLFVAALTAALTSAAAPAPEPKVPDIQQQLRDIESAVQRGNADALRIQFQEKARTRPGDVLLRVYIAWCTMPSDDAWNQLKNITAIYPEHPWARLGMGRVYLKWKMPDQAQNEFNLALKKDPRFYPALVGLGEVARRKGDLEAAAAKFQAALQIQDDAEAHLGLGLTAAARSDAGTAKKELARAVALWPDQPRALEELARIAREEQDLPSAISWTEKLADLSPRDAAARKALGDLRFDAGQKEAAAKDYERALRLGAVTSELYLRLASLYRETQDGDGEARALEQLSALQKDVPDHPARLAVLAEHKGDMEGAESQWLEALERAPKRADLHAHLAQLRARRENFREAMDAYRDALAAPDDKPEGLQAEADALFSKFHLPKKQAKGTVDAIYNRVFANLNAFYTERLKQKADLGGALRLRVRVDDTGKVLGVDVLEDTVGDPWLVGHAYFALKDAEYPKKKREPVFEFELRPPASKGKK